MAGRAAYSPGCSFWISNDVSSGGEGNPASPRDWRPGVSLSSRKRSQRSRESKATTTQPSSEDRRSGSSGLPEE